jgi:hypothetical protein
LWQQTKNKVIKKTLLKKHTHPRSRPLSKVAGRSGEKPTVSGCRYNNDHIHQTASAVTPSDGTLLCRTPYSSSSSLDQDILSTTVHQYSTYIVAVLVGPDWLLRLQPPLFDQRWARCLAKWHREIGGKKVFRASSFSRERLHVSKVYHQRRLLAIGAHRSI